MLLSPTQGHQKDPLPLRQSCMKSQSVVRARSNPAERFLARVRIILCHSSSAARALLAFSLALFLGGCIFPTTGPSPVEIQAASSETLPYALVPITKLVIDILAANEPQGLAGAFRDQRLPSVIKFGVGDSVKVTIFESAAGGLFIPAEASVRPGNFIDLPEQMVDNQGNISVPYAGTVRAAGKTNVEIQNEIISRLKNRAIEPQVIVSLSQQRTNLVSVIGEVKAPIRFPAPFAGARDKITDALTRAGGIAAPGYETWVTLERDKRRATVPFENLISYPANNIYLQPGDEIYVYREAQRFIAFGAAGEQGVFPFDAWRINLAEAVAKAKGLVDTQADPASVFLYRREPRNVAEALGADMSQFPTDEVIPVIFSVSFRDPGGYFLATQLQMRNQDVIFVANAASVEVTKFLTLVNLATSTLNQGSSAAWYASNIR
jgi:polysaccharide export outer membrane protein